MNLEEAYKMALKYRYRTLVLFLELAISEKGILSWDDDLNEIEYFLQDRFEKCLCEQLSEYAAKRGSFNFVVN
ncbi:hypothetical protein [Heyndrickxia sporothermodurans]|uniref:hypothetical protein n=1 Tax=Heyndrickxia sporothermodurans TaxID=46224 RepID=UPI002E1F206C|nr:hypothetical protein [Heyndrickxia sporothermodurans]MED3696904.1 hypothetical protein [Heyndrickxia sporothermodurans]MED3781083.1 hypothetical protein [Heyndrickxia sporothermodurans]